MRSKRTKGYIDEIAKNNELTNSEVQEIVESFFRFTVDVMREGNTKTMQFDQVRLFKFGIFKVKEGRKRHFERINKKNEKSITNSK